MKFKDLDQKMRVYETLNDRYILPNMYIVARLDGRGFTKLTKEIIPFEAPFDIQFKDYIVETVKHLMNCGFNIVYGFTQSDEISLLLNINDNSFSRKERKYLSVLAGEASAKFSTMLGHVATFDCRLSQLPNRKIVIDYFRWRNEDAHRNSLNAYCYWLLRKQGVNKTMATKEIKGLSTSGKNELLFSLGVNYNDIPSWQKRGIGFYWKKVQVEKINPKTQEQITVTRNTLHIEENLPLNTDYDNFLSQILTSQIQ